MKANLCYFRCTVWGYVNYREIGARLHEGEPVLFQVPLYPHLYLHPCPYLYLYLYLHLSLFAYNVGLCLSVLINTCCCG